MVRYSKISLKVTIHILPRELNLQCMICNNKGKNDNVRHKPFNNYLNWHMALQEVVMGSLEHTQTNADTSLLSI